VHLPVGDVARSHLQRDLALFRGARGVSGPQQQVRRSEAPPAAYFFCPSSIARIAAA
jgi:hypothetical protein